jgi:two-component system nitrate/nitrite sensor histidine kinase NarX
MAVAKQRSDEEAWRLSIMQERNAMAHELHDSLAQTLASLRFKVRMMEDSLPGGESCTAALDDLQGIRHGIDEAHVELRELLNSFRAPAYDRGLISALEKLVQRFSSESGIAAYFQQECDNMHLSSAEEIQMLRIVQESLANTRKHAHAKTVRVLLTCRHDTYALLIEDDGVGFGNKPREGTPGEHIGLSIMEERAQKMGATLSIESEPGEGTRVELIYKPARKLQDVRTKWVM